MSDQNTGTAEVFPEQASPRIDGKLFGNSMFGFNRDEVLEYLEEVAEENTQRQKAAEMRLQEMAKKLEQLQKNTPSVGELAAAEPQQKQVALLKQELEISHRAAQQAEEELFTLKEQFSALQKEHARNKEADQSAAGSAQQLRTELQNAVAEQQRGQAQQATLQQQLNEAMQMLSQLRLQLASQNQNSSREEAAALQQLLNTRESELEAVKTQLSFLRESKTAAPLPAPEDAQLRRQLNDALLQAESLRLQLRQKEEELQSVREFARGYGDLEKEAASLRRELEAKTLEVEDLRGQQRSSLTAWAGAAALQEQLQTQTAEVQKLRTQLQTLQKEREIPPERSYATAHIQSAAATLLNEAKIEAERIRREAITERSRLQAQMRLQAETLSSNLLKARAQLDRLDTDASLGVQSLQDAFSGVSSALVRTEQTLGVLNVQIEQFAADFCTPPPSAPVQLPRSQVTQERMAVPPARPVPERLAPLPLAEQDHPRWPNPAASAQTFQPTYSSSPTANNPWPSPEQSPCPQDGNSPEAKQANLSHTVNNAVRRMMK